jgi:hypothetical protein
MPEKGALLAVLIVERPLCVDCIAEKSAIRAAEIEPFSPASPRGLPSPAPSIVAGRAARLRKFTSHSVRSD